MRTESEFLVVVLERLNVAGVEYMLTGSMAPLPVERRFGNQGLHGRRITPSTWLFFSKLAAIRVVFSQHPILIP